MAVNLKSLLTKITTDILFTSGGQIKSGGDILTSFHSEKLAASGQISATTVSGMITELNNGYAGPSMGSVYIGTEYTPSVTLGSSTSNSQLTIPVGWYNYVTYKIPSTPRILLFGMSPSSVVGKNFIVYSTSIIAEFQPQIVTKGSMSNGTTTYYNLNGTSGTHYYYVRQGNIVTVNLNVKCTTPSSSFTTFASGLPKHNQYYVTETVYQGTSQGKTQVDGVMGSLSCATTNIAPMKCKITPNGEIQGAGGTAGEYFYGSISYLANN